MAIFAALHPLLPQCRYLFDLCVILWGRLRIWGWTFVQWDDAGLYLDHVNSSYGETYGISMIWVDSPKSYLYIQLYVPFEQPLINEGKLAIKYRSKYQRGQWANWENGIFIKDWKMKKEVFILKSATALIRWHRGQKGSGTAAKEGATQQKSPQRRINSPYPTTRLEAIRRITTISCRCYPKSFWNTSA